MKANNQIFKGKSLNKGSLTNNERPKQTPEDFKGLLDSEMKNLHSRLKSPGTEMHTNQQPHSKTAILVELISTNY